ncbi:adenylate cyclase-like protein, partial [Rhodofomes roseus]
IRIYRANGTYHVVACELNITVAMLIPELNKKLSLDPDREPHSLYLKERERVLAMTEKPANIVRRRLEQAGYDEADGLEELGADDLAFLMKFEYKSNVLGPLPDDLHVDTFDLIDLTGRSLRTVPVLLYPHADAIFHLNLSRNPMLEIPLDFIQACTTLRELRLSHMAMKKVPQSIRHCTTLHRLDLSCNRIADLDEAALDRIPDLRSLKVQNNRMEKLPWYFPRLRHLKDLNVSNNKFRTLPTVVTQLTKLVDLDISFNMLEKLPEDIGLLEALERLIIVGNQVSEFPATCSRLSNLKMLDCRRNHITDLAIMTALPKVEQIFADHNSVHALDLSFGPCLRQLDASHNDITQLTVLPGPIGQPYALTSLDISHAKLSALDERALAQLTALETLRIDHNSIRYIPDSLGNLTHLLHLSCSNNQLRALPSTIGNLQRLETLEVHNNSLAELPPTLWNCASLQLINATSNLLGSWRVAPAHNVAHIASLASQGAGDSDMVTPPPRSASLPDRKASGSSASTNSSRALPPIVYSLERLYLGENRMTDENLQTVSLLQGLQILNLSFNDIQEIPASFFRSMTNLEELYLSGNKLSAIPTEDLNRLTKLHVLFLNGNKLQTLPQELGKLSNLTVLDVGSNILKYNIFNWEFDWNWNFNKNLQYLNLSGNKRLEIRTDLGHIKDDERRKFLADFSGLTQLRVLGLIDITVTNGAMIPDENEDRRVRTSLSEVNGMAYGIADTLGFTEHLNMLDLVQPNFRGSEDEAIFAMFGRSSHIGNNHYINSYLRNRFLEVYSSEMDRLKPEKWEDISDALRRTFLKLNRHLHDYLYSTSGRKMSHVSTSTAVRDITNKRSGASGIVLHLDGRTLYVANIGRSLAVISRGGDAELLSRCHDPFDRQETLRIRSAEGWVAPKGAVNDEIDVSRSFGFYNLLPVVNARPYVTKWELSEQDEFVIVGNSGLWDHVSYQTAVDIARTERGDPMIAAQKLRDLAISHGADGTTVGTTMIMVIAVSDLFKGPARSRQPTMESIIDTEAYLSSKRRRRDEHINNRDISRLDGEIPAPTGHLAMVFTDIRNSTHLWEVNAGMPTAIVLHNNLLRRLLRRCGGYEVKTEGDAFMCSFPTALAALWFCLSVQTQLLQVDWPLEILECEDGKEIYDQGGKLVARGLSVRMGIHCGIPVCEPDPVTGRMDYFGPMVNRSARIEGAAAGGQIMCSADVVREINARILETEPETEYSHLQPSQAVEAIRNSGIVVVPVGQVKLKGLEVPETLSLVYPRDLSGRQSLVKTDANPSASRVQFSVNQMRELAMLCVRLEMLSSG